MNGWCFARDTILYICTPMLWQRAWYISHIRKISWLVQGYTPWKVTQDVNQFALSAGFVWMPIPNIISHSHTTIFSAALWIKDHSSAKSLEVLRLLSREHVGTTLTRVPESSCRDMGSIVYRGKPFVLVLHCKNYIFIRFFPIAMDNWVWICYSPWLECPPEYNYSPRLHLGLVLFSGYCPHPWAITYTCNVMTIYSASCKIS